FQELGPLLPCPDEIHVSSFGFSAATRPFQTPPLSSNSQQVHFSVAGSMPVIEMPVSPPPTQASLRNALSRIHSQRSSRLSPRAPVPVQTPPTRKSPHSLSAFSAAVAPFSALASLLGSSASPRWAAPVSETATTRNAIRVIDMTVLLHFKTAK